MRTEFIEEMIVLAGLVVNGILDLRKREVSLPVVGVMTASGLICRLFSNHLEPGELVVGLLPGILALMVAVVGGGCIGYGDVWLMLGMGPVLGGAVMLQVCMTALFLTGLCGLILIVCFHRGRKDELPFVPFLLAAQLWTMIGGG